MALIGILLFSAFFGTAMYEQGKHDLKKEEQCISKTKEVKNGKETCRV